ncbi:MAG: hypothetical protein JWL62_2850 [Hyphomicrobiales bacterium]|nr:hypothetical protein [Hyphomicrobiales bacterium]
MKRLACFVVGTALSSAAFAADAPLETEEPGY